MGWIGQFPNASWVADGQPITDAPYPGLGQVTLSVLGTGGQDFPMPVTLAEQGGAKDWVAIILAFFRSNPWAMAVITTLWATGILGAVVDKVRELIPGAPTDAIVSALGELGIGKGAPGGTIQPQLPGGMLPGAYGAVSVVKQFSTTHTRKDGSQVVVRGVVLSDGRIGMQKLSGVWKFFRPGRNVVWSRKIIGRMKLISRQAAFIHEKVFKGGRAPSKMPHRRKGV